MFKFQTFTYNYSRCGRKSCESIQEAEYEEMQKILSKILLINECVESLDFERLPSLHIDNNWWESQSRVLVTKVLWANNFQISLFPIFPSDNNWSIFINLLFFSCSCWWTSLAELSHGLQRVREEVQRKADYSTKSLKFWNEEKDQLYMTRCMVI